MSPAPALEEARLPTAVDLVLAFHNSHAGPTAERFVDGGGLRVWLQETGFGGLPVTDADAAAARELRDALGVLLLAHAGEGADSDALASAEAFLQRISARYPLRADVRAHSVRLRPAGESAIGVYAAILGAVSELALAGTWGRVKACRNPRCHEGFYDTTKNGSALYHAPGCRSQVSMRAYRERKKDLQA